MAGPSFTNGRAAGEVEHEDPAHVEERTGDPVPSHPALSAAATALLASIGGTAAIWWAMSAEEQRAKAVALLRDAGMSEADATARAASYGDAEIIERLVRDLAAARRGPSVSARTRASIGHLARGASLTAEARVASALSKKSTGGAAKVALGLLALKILLG